LTDTTSFGQFSSGSFLVEIIEYIGPSASDEFGKIHMPIFREEAFE
jgi:hypothetical protein